MLLGLSFRHARACHSRGFPVVSTRWSQRVASSCLNASQDSVTHHTVVPKVMELLGMEMTSWLVVGVVTLVLWLTSRRPRGLPPGPALCLPVVGHLPLMRGDPRHVLMAMRKQYGDVFHLYMGSRLVVVLCGYEAMKEALVKNADVFSDRPSSYFMDVILERKGVTSASGQHWKEQRKFALTALREFGFGKNILQTKVLEEATALTETIAQEKGKSFDVKFLLQTSVCNVICSFVFGKRFDYRDPTFLSFLENMDLILANTGGAQLINFFPFLKYFPGDLGRSRSTKATSDRMRELLVKPAVEEHLKNFDPTRPSEDFIDAYIREMKKKEEAGETTTMDYPNLLQNLMDLFIAGTETTATILRWCLVYLLHFPQLQQRLQEEIQDKIGVRPPRMEDRAALPLVNAFMQEVLRHASIIPLNLDHGVSRDTVFRGYRLPKGTMVIPFLESALKDPAVWRDPDDFRPDRFLQDGKLVTVERLVPFSLGRRVCLGESLARMEIFLFLVTMVQHFRFVYPEGSSPPSLKGHLGMVHTPHPFKMQALPRV